MYVFLLILLFSMSGSQSFPFDWPLFASGARPPDCGHAILQCLFNGRHLYPVEGDVRQMLRGSKVGMFLLVRPIGDT